jgi:receptor-binding and translocation channel-forming TcA subunit of Tc toxin
VDASRDELAKQIQQRLAANDTRSQEFQLLGKGILVRTLASFSATLPGLDRRVKAHEPLLRFVPPDGQPVMRETNPRVYAALLTATARLEQLKAGFNYLGYLDTYVPPWRFQFLLERARYFAEHAKNAQREYLNFLSNAEREEFQELSASQNVEMEKSNIRIETARVDQANAEVAAASESVLLAAISAQNAHTRFETYKTFDKYADDIMGRVGALAVFDATKALPNPIEDFGSTILENVLVIGGLFSSSKRKLVEAAQREVEKKNLKLALGEANQAKIVADKQKEVAEKALIVAGLQRQAALLRHEFAIQNLEFLRNRVLSAEQWYRLGAAIRSVSETYLRYSVELAFLAEQAYEFEADKRINVIRFDYDLSEVGDFLAADFLMRDLDTLEQDLIVTQRQRQQHVRYVLSMAREFPEALQEIRDSGKTTFSLRLEQIEKRFPGLYNLRIGAVDVLPVALMDSTRFSLELTHLGTSQVRMKAQPDTPPGTPSSSPLNTNDLPVPEGGWLAELQETWPIKLRVTGPETAVFSGLTRQEANAVFPFVTTSQRHAFEALGAAAAWQVDFTARENQVVPDSLADLLMTFTVSGYHDSELRAAIDAVKPQTSALTSFLSAQQTFPDAFYDFSRTGRMVWKVPREMLTLNGDLGRLRNIGFSLRPGAPDVHFSRLMTRLRVNFRINESGAASGVTVFTALPEGWVIQTAPLTVDVAAGLDTATELAWDFGDGTPILRTIRSGTTPIAPAVGAHAYAKPGRYVIKLRCIQNDSLSEFRISVAVARNHILGDPLIVFPRVIGTTGGTVEFGVSAGGFQTGRAFWRVGDLTAEGNSATFTLKPGHYTLDFAAVRKGLKFMAYGAQRYVNGATALPLRGLSATTNRTFNENGDETNGTGTPTPLPARNELAKRLFDKGEISPEDDWTFELIPEEILGVPAGTAIGAEELDLSDIQDVVLAMEYDITPGGP